MTPSNSILVKRVFATSLLGMGLFISPVIAQEETTKEFNNISALVEPRFGGLFQTGPGAGYESSFGSLYGFVPFAQTAGVSTFYGEGRFSAFTDAGGEGGGLKAGYRRFLPKSNLVVGGYTGFDLRQTGANKTFQQLGLGAEVLGEKWEARINGYIPVGETRQTVGSSSTDTGLIGSTAPEVSDLRFEQNQLLYSLITGSLFRQQTETTFSEAAMSGFDIEGGYQLSKWDSGKLYAYGGLYFLDAEGRDALVGVRGRLQAEINDVLAGISLSTDEEFGTNLQFSFGVQFGGQGKKTGDGAKDSVLARLGQGVQRQDIIAIDQQVESQTITTEIPGTTQNNVVAKNPDTGAEWKFIHVKDGSGGSGTFEAPFGEVTDATNAIGAIGTVNDIIYVDSGDLSGMTGFTIPDNVQALSTGVSQSIDIVDLGITQLPGSGTGTLPLVQSTVTMGNNTRLSGFRVEMSDANGVKASNVSDFTIDRNIISTTGDSAEGIYVYAYDNSTINNASISGNTISTTGDFADGIYVYVYNSATINNASISGNTISTTGRDADGIYVYVYNSATINNASISGNTISTTGRDADGIYIYGGNSATISDASISGNTISTAGRGADGIYVYGYDSTISGVSISGNTITTAGTYADGIYVYGYDSTISDASISGNTISTAGSGADGIYVYGRNSATISDASISENTISTAGERASGINVRGYNSTTISDASISGNTISTAGNYASGIYVRGVNSTISDASISGNTISTMGGGANGIFVFGSNSAVISDASISGNTITTAGNYANGILVFGYNSTISSASISGNTITTAGNYANGILVFGYNSTISSASISGNTVSQAGANSFRVLSQGASDICIAQFSGNVSTNPGVAGGGSDLLISFAAGTIDFVDFVNVAANNAGFDDISGDMPSTPPACP